MAKRAGAQDDGDRQLALRVAFAAEGRARRGHFPPGGEGDERSAAKRGTRDRQKRSIAAVPIAPATAPATTFRMSLMPRQVSHRTRIGPFSPGNGSGAASRAPRRHAPLGRDGARVDRHDGTGAPPRARHLPRDQDGARPHPRGPELRCGGRHRRRAARGRLPGGGRACRRSAGGAPLPSLVRRQRGTPSRPRRGSIRRRQACAPPSSAPAIASNAARPRTGEMPAHSANDSAVVGPNTWR